MASAKLREVLAGTEEELSMDMSPMIDLVFLLLIFFMVSSHMIIVKIDARVKPPKAESAEVQQNSAGRIVINILSEEEAEKAGGVYIFGADKLELKDSTAITDYVDRQHQMNKETGISSRLHVRADRNTDTKHIKKVVQASGEAGVIEVIFGSYKIP